MVNKLPLALRGEQERAGWSWTHANRVRRAISGGLGAREVILVPPLAIDEALGDRGITDADKLNAIPPENLGRWVDADALVYGELLDYEAYYAFLVAAWRVSARVRMVSTEDGHEIFSCTDDRYDVTLSPVVDPIDVLSTPFSLCSSFAIFLWLVPSTRWAARSSSVFRSPSKTSPI